MNTLQSVIRVRYLLNIVTMAFSLGIAAPSFAGLTVSTFPDSATWTGSPMIVTTTTPQATLTVNQQVSGPDVTQTQTIKTGASGFKLDKLVIYAGGKGGGTGRLNIYPDPVGGENTDGFVNTSFSTDLLNGGAGLDFTFNGNPGLHYFSLDLTGADEITLAPNQQYAVEIDITGGQWSWQRSAGPGAYLDGNIYQGATELNFNGTPPANNRGERNQVGGTPDRDGGLALYRQDGSMTVSMQPDGSAWPGSPVHTTTGAADLTAAFDQEVTLENAQPEFQFPGGAATHTFTPSTTFKLDKFMIRAAGAPTTGELYLYQNVNGGTETNGFVNVSQNEGALIAGVPFTFDGVLERTLLEFDLAGNYEVTLQAGVEYAIDLRNTGTGDMYWMRADTNDYTGGNIYVIGVDAGTERFDVVPGDVRRDAALALYAAPAGVPGDFNNNGTVDAADYVTWRANTGNAALPNDNGVGNQAARYTLWRSAFGNSGSGAGLSAGGAVPEPSACLIAIVAIGLFVLRRSGK
jgi:hypothetical protein